METEADAVAAIYGAIAWTAHKPKQNKKIEKENINLCFKINCLIFIIQSFLI